MQRKSIYKYASEAGVPIGLYLTLMSACILLSLKIPALPLLLLPLVLGFPFLLWVMMKKILREEPGYNKFSSIWLGGIYTVIFGCVICLFFSAFYIAIFEPNFVSQYVSNAIATVESSPMASDYAQTTALMKEAMNAHILPSSFEFLTTMAWLTCFTGSILSLVLALVLTKSGKKVTRQYPV